MNLRDPEDVFADLWGDSGTTTTALRDPEDVFEDLWGRQPEPLDLALTEPEGPRVPYAEGPSFRPTPARTALEPPERRPLLQPAEPSPVAAESTYGAQPAPAPPDEDTAIGRGFVRTMAQQNPRAVAGGLEAVSHFLPEYGPMSGWRSMLQNASQGLRDLAAEEAPTRQGPQRLSEIQDLEGALTWAGETAGEGLASTVPSIVTGAVGAAVGMAGGGPLAAAVGARLGAAAPSYLLNTGDLYEALQAQGATAEEAAKWAAGGGALVTFFDVAGLQGMFRGATKPLRDRAVKAIARRIVQDGGVGALWEGSTEGIQALIELETVEEATGKAATPAERREAVISSAIGGALVGGPVGAGASVGGAGLAHREAPASQEERIGLVRRLQGAGEKPVQWIKQAFGKRPGELTKGDLEMAEAMLPAEGEESTGRPVPSTGEPVPPTVEAQEAPEPLPVRKPVPVEEQPQPPPGAPAEAPEPVRPTVRESPVNIEVAYPDGSRGPKEAQLALHEARFRFRKNREGRMVWQAATKGKGITDELLAQRRAVAQRLIGEEERGNFPGEQREAEFRERNKDVKRLSEDIERRLGIDLAVYRTNAGDIELSHIEVPKERRRQGIGTQAMEELVKFADARGERIILSVGQKDPVHGTTSRTRLVQFYKRFGFIENKGRNKDYTITAGMYRRPVEGAAPEGRLGTPAGQGEPVQVAAPAEGTVAVPAAAGGIGVRAAPRSGEAAASPPEKRDVYRGQTDLPFDPDMESARFPGLVFATPSPDAASVYAEGARGTVIKLRDESKNPLDLRSRGALRGTEEIRKAISNALGTEIRFDAEIAPALRAAGHDAVRLLEHIPGRTDVHESVALLRAIPPPAASASERAGGRDLEAPAAEEPRKEAAASTAEAHRRAAHVPAKLTPFAVIRRMGGLDPRTIERLQADLPQETGKVGQRLRRQLREMSGGHGDMEVLLQDAAAHPEYAAVFGAAGIRSHDDLVNAVRTGALFQAQPTRPEVVSAQQEVEERGGPRDEAEYLEDLGQRVRTARTPVELMGVTRELESARRALPYEQYQELSQELERSAGSMEGAVPFERRAPYTAPLLPGEKRELPRGQKRTTGGKRLEGTPLFEALEEKRAETERKAAPQGDLFEGVAEAGADSPLAKMLAARYVDEYPDPEDLQAAGDQLRNIAGIGPASGEMRLYRATAVPEAGVRPLTSWSTDPAVASAYVANPGRGGQFIRVVDVPGGRVLRVGDIHTRDGKALLAEQLGYEDPAGTGDEWMNNGWRYPWEESGDVAKKLRASGYDFLAYEDDYPAGATTIVPLREIDAIERVRSIDVNDVAREVGPVYHGSRKKFGRFSSEKIGTGEGAQAFGHGLYFTSIDEIARTYPGPKPQHTDPADLREWGHERGLSIETIVDLGLLEDKYGQPISGMAYHQRRVLADQLEEEAARSAKNIGTELASDWVATAKEVAQVLRGELGSLPPPASRYLYTATLHKGKQPGEYTWLDWSEPITPEQRGKITAQITKELGPDEVHGVLMPEVWAAEDTAERVYRALSETVASQGEVFDAAKASALLLRAGIDGIRYPTGTLSGFGPEGSGGWNYVVFDDSAITIEGREVFEKGQPYQLDLFNKETLDAEERNLSTTKGDLRRSDRSGIRRIAAALQTAARTTGHVDLTGLVVKSAHEVAKVAQIWRNPHFESLWLIYTDAEGRILANEGFSSKAPGYTGTPLYEAKGGQRDWRSHDLFVRNFEKLKDRIGRLRDYGGEVRVWVLHNHPSGDPNPSNEDLTFSDLFGSQLEAAGGTYAGDVIIDSDQFAHIDPSGKAQVLALKSGRLAVKAPALPPEFNVEGLPEGIITKPDHVAEIGVAMQTPDNQVSLIYRGSDGRARALEQVPIGFFRQTDQVKGYLRNRMRLYGAPDVFAYYGGQAMPEEEFLGISEELIRTGVLEHGVSNKTESWATEPRARRIAYKRQPEVIEPVRRVAEERAPYEGAVAAKKLPKKPPARQGAVDLFRLEVPEETRRQWLERKLVDKLNRLRQVEELAEVIPAEARASVEADLFIGRASDQIDRFSKDMVEGEGSFVRRLLDAGHSVEDLGLYLLARHAEERNAYIQEMNEEFTEGGSGLTDQETEDILDEYEGSGIEAFAAEFYDKVPRAALHIRRKAELLDDEDVAGLQSRWEFYVPLKGKAGETTYPRTGKGFSVAGKEFKRAKGRRSLPDNPFIQALIDYEEAVVRAEKNRVGQAMLALVEANPSEAWSAERQQFRPIFDAEGELQYMEPRMGQLPDNVMGVKRIDEDGKSRLYHITIKDKALAEGMKNLGAEKAVPVLQNVNAYLRAVNTTLNPEFLITNLERDLQTAGVHLVGEHGADVAGRVAKSLLAAMRGIWRNVRDKGDDEWARAYADLKATGGKVGWFDSKGFEEKAAAIQKRVDQINRGGRNVQEAVRATGKLISDLNEAVESGVRLATYKTLVDAGVDKKQAALVAKNLTVNFNTKGTWGTILNSMYLFSNAGIQGSARIFRAMGVPGRPKTRGQKRVQAIVGGIVASSFMNALYNRWMEPEDWEDISPWVKNNYWLWFLPNGKAIGVKMPYGYNVFAVIGSVAEEAVNGSATAAEGATRLFGAFGDAFNPLSGGSFAQFLSPTLFDPFVQVAENKAWHGGPIYKDQPSFGPKIPESQRYFDSVRPLTKALTNWLNAVTGGSEELRGRVDVNPEIVDMVLDQLGGGTGRFVANAINTAEQLALARSLPDSDQIPMVRQFIKSPSQWMPQKMARRALEESRRTPYSQDQHDRFRAAVVRAVARGAIDPDDGNQMVDEFAVNQAQANWRDVDALWDRHKELKESGENDEARLLLNDARQAVAHLSRVRIRLAGEAERDKASAEIVKVAQMALKAAEKDPERYREYFRDRRKRAEKQYKLMEMVHYRALVEVSKGEKRQVAVKQLVAAAKDFEGWPEVYRSNKKWVDAQVKAEVNRLKEQMPG